MDEKIRCTKCNSTEFFDYNLQGSCSGGVCSFQRASTFVCRKCGHIEWFIDEATIKSLLEFESKEADYEKALKKHEADKAAIQKRITELQAIIADEEQTVKAVNDAKQALRQDQSKLQSLPIPPQKDYGFAGFYGSPFRQRK